MKPSIVFIDTKVNSDLVYTLNKDEDMTVVLFIHNTNDVRLTVNLKGEYARARVIGLVVAADDTKIVLHTQQHHQSPHTTSNLLVKGVFSGKSTFFYDGSIIVDKQAQKTDAYQRNENLLLSENAHAESKPSLEILANDVRCTHGATIGTVDDDQLWYLNTRGISTTMARKLIVDGFLESALGSIESVEWKKEARKLLWQTL